MDSSENRKKFIANPACFQDLPAAAFELVSGNKEAGVRQALVRQGISTDTCYVIIEDSRFNTQALGVSEALCETLEHQRGTVLVFGNADVLFYELETMKMRYISRPRLFG